MVPRRSKQQISTRLRCTGQEGEMLRQYQDHEERPRFAILCRKSEVSGRCDGGCRWWSVPGIIVGSCELSLCLIDLLILVLLAKKKPLSHNVWSRDTNNRMKSS